MFAKFPQWTPGIYKKIQEELAKIQEQKRQTFSVSVPKSDAPCGGIFDHNIACIACVNDACGSLNKGDIINVRYELDTPGCVNRVRIFTEPNNNGKCFAAVIPSVMITG